MAGSRASRSWRIGAAGLLAALAMALLAFGPLVGRAGAKKMHHHYNPYGGGFQLVQSSPLQVSAANQINSKLYAACPAWRHPYGGAVSAMPLPASNGQGVFPLGIERRGGAADVHFILMGFGPNSGANFIPRSVTGEAVCGPKPYKMVPVQTIVQVDPGQTMTLVSTCPPGRTLIGGNFARTYFTPSGGDFATESRGDIANNSWVVSATAFGSLGGPVTDTAFCAQFHPGSLGHLIELTDSDGVSPGATGASTTPACPAGTRFVWGGFNSSPPGSVIFAGGYINPDQTYSAYGYNRSSAPATFDYFSYCLPKNAFKGFGK
jgi:hypothetical protein